MFPKFPYTNFHQLNLDWILRKVKELDEKFGLGMYEAMQQYIDEHLGDFLTNAAYDPDHKLITLNDVDSPATTGGQVEAFNIGDESSPYIYVHDRSAIHEAELNGHGDKKVTITAIKDPNTADYGDNFLIEDQGKYYVIDFGNNASYFLQYLSDHNIEHIDAVIITHFHNDHLGGTSGYATLFTGAYDWTGTTFYLPHGGIDYSQFLPAGYGDRFEISETHMREYILNCGGTIIYPIEGQEIQISDRVRATFHNIGAAFYNQYYGIELDDYGTLPDIDDPNRHTNYNNFCMVTVFNILGKTALFAGDLGYAGQQANAESLQGAYFMAVPHHGLSAYNSDGFLSGLDTAYAVVGSRGLQHYGNGVTERVSGIGGQVYDTYNGTQIFTFTAGGIIADNKPILFGHADYYNCNVLPQGADLDNYLMPGIYHSSSASRTLTLVNAPLFVRNPSSFRLDVIDLKRSGNSVIQIVTMGSAYGFNPEVYARTRADTDGHWSDWILISGRVNIYSEAAGIGCTLSERTLMVYSGMATLSCKVVTTSAIATETGFIKINRMNTIPDTSRAYISALCSDGNVRQIVMRQPSSSADYLELFTPDDNGIPSGITMYLTVTFPAKIVKYPTPTP